MGVINIYSFPWSTWFGTGIVYTEFWNEPFTYADGTLTTGDGNWVPSGLDAGLWQVVSNTIQSSSSDAAGAAAKDATSLASVTFTNPWRFEFSIRCQDVSASTGCIVAFGDATANALYLTFPSGITGGFSLDHTATTQNTSDATSDFSASDQTVRIQHVSRGVTVSVGGVQKASMTLSTDINLTDKRIELFVAPPTAPSGRTWKLDSFVFSTGA